MFCCSWYTRCFCLSWYTQCFVVVGAHDVFVVVGAHDVFVVVGTHNVPVDDELIQLDSGPLSVPERDQRLYHPAL